MTTMTCDHCYAITSNGLALCELCQFRLAQNFEAMPVYFANLSRWRPGSAGVRSVPGSREPRLVTSGSDRVSRALDEAGAKITGWAQALVEDRPQLEIPAAHGEASSVRIACWFLTQNLTTIATLGWAGEIVAETSVIQQSLDKLTTEVAPGWYAGECQRDGCGCDTFVVPGLTWVNCRRCGAMTYARDHLETVLDEARVYRDRPKALAGIVVALVDTEQSVPRLYDRIRRWAADERIVGTKLTRRAYVWSEDEDRMVVGVEEYGPTKYRLGDVLDRVLDAHSTDRAARAS